MWFVWFKGDVSQVSEKVGNAGEALKTLATYIQTLADNIDTVSFDGVDKLVASQDDSTKASNEFYATFSQLNNPLNTVFQTLSLLTGFLESLQNLSNSLEAEIEATCLREKM